VNHHAQLSILKFLTIVSEHVLNRGNTPGTMYANLCGSLAARPASAGLRPGRLSYLVWKDMPLSSPNVRVVMTEVTPFWMRETFRSRNLKGHEKKTNFSEK
jgi:hypothetical protein